MDEGDISGSRHDTIPAPAFCGYHADLDGLVLRIRIRSTFDRENRGRPWANDIVNAFTMPLERLEVDFEHATIVSSTVFAGLVQLYQGFQGRVNDGVHLTHVGTQVLRSLKMLKLDPLFTIRLRGS
ncbi:MAG: hypothetical protein ACOCXJ_08185 [Planctomycetota bacterium]